VLIVYVCVSDLVQSTIMAGTNTQKKDLSDGELSDDDDGEDLDTSACKTCNLTFTNSKVSSISVHESHLLKSVMYTAVYSLRSVVIVVVVVKYLNGVIKTNSQW